MSDDGSPPVDEPARSSSDGALGNDTPDDERDAGRDDREGPASADRVDAGADGAGADDAVDAEADGRIDTDAFGDGADVGVDARRGRDAQESLLSRLRSAEGGVLLYVREVLTSVLAVLFVGMLLFAISGVWPPMVAVESGSMQPHMHRGDLVFITEPGRYAPETAVGDTGVVTTEVGEGTGYRSFGDYGAVIVYDNPRIPGSPIIHRARFWVDDGENWFDRANPEYVQASSCEALLNCPAPHAGFITKGDHNDRYDQANGISEPVKPKWVTGIARVRIPYLGMIRLELSELGRSGLAVSQPAVAAPTEESGRPFAPEPGTCPVGAA